MHIPMQVDYGIRALVDLASRREEGPVRTSEIAGRQSIPEPYLAQVMHALQKNGLTRSQRGPLGGHALAKDPSEISMGMVMTRLGGPTTIVGCLDEAGRCDQSPACGQRGVWRDVEAAINGVLDAISIADLVARAAHPDSEAQGSARPLAGTVRR